MTNFALFDLDNTLLLGDSDYAWGEYLAAHNIVDPIEFSAKNKQYYRDYVAGTLNISEYYAFSLAPLVNNPRPKMEALRAQFIDDIIIPIIPESAKKLVKKHQSQGHICAIITATQRFVTSPIAELFDIQHLLATEPEIINGRFTGKIVGEPCFQGGKIAHFKNWLQHENMSDLKSFIYAYSDSYNDLPLLEMANHPVATNPDEKLTVHAKQHNWPILNFAHT